MDEDFGSHGKHGDVFLTTDLAPIQRIFLTTNRTNETIYFAYELDELNEFFAFLAKAPSGWFPKSLG